MRVRKVDNQEYLGVLKDMILEGHEVSLLVSGSSMSPFICHGRDYVYLSEVKRELRFGDIVFFQRENDDYILHRIIKVNKDGTYDITGDNQNWIEKNVRREQIFAIVTQVKRKDKMIKPGDFWWIFFAQVWTRVIPFRRVLEKVYGISKRIIRKK